MRLIDADKIDYDKFPLWEYEHDGKKVTSHVLAAFESTIDNMPTIDAVPVVRCKNCKWYGDNWVSRIGSVCMNSRLKTGYGNLWVEDDFYCGYGEEHGVE